MTIRCINCEVILTENALPYIRCTECTTKTSDVLLCVWCFLMGAECGAHKRGHNYQVEDPCGASVFNTKHGCERPWGWKQDMQLIIAAHKYRLGNWDEIAKCLKCNKTAEEAKNHFDRYFVRGALGRHASNIVARPFIDDMTKVEECDEMEREPVFHGDARPYATTSKWQYIRDYFLENSPKIDLNDASWFEQIRDDLRIYKNKQLRNGHHSETTILGETLFADATPPNNNNNNNISNNTNNNSNSMNNSANSSFNAAMVAPSSSLHSPTPFTSPIHIQINSTDGSSDESNELGGGGGNIATRTRHFSHTLNTARRLSNVGLQSSGDESDHSMALESARYTSLPGPSHIKKIRLMSKKDRAIKQSSKSFLKDGNKLKNGNLSSTQQPKMRIKISEHDQERLLANYTESYMHSIHATEASRIEKMTRLREDDLQLLAYMPKRDDFEHEYNNECERLISRLQLSPSDETDEDEQFANEVKLSKVLYYNRQLMQRRQRKSLLREFDLIGEFFDKIKSKATLPRKRLSSPVRLPTSSTSASDDRRYLLNKVRQVVNKDEFKQLNDVLSKMEQSSKRIEQLKDLKAHGIKVLKPGQKVENDHHHQIRRRKRRGDKYKTSQRKAALRWNRFKRWNRRQQLKTEATESET